MTGKWTRKWPTAWAMAILTAIFGVVLFAEWTAPNGYERQFRESISTSPSSQFLLGTDSLGRDRFARLLHGSRLSLLLAPAAAAISVLLAAIVGALAAFGGKRWGRWLVILSDLALSLPWLFLLITIRASLPLDVTPEISIAITFLLLGLLGWAGPSKVIRAGVKKIVESDYIFQARAMGTSNWRIFYSYVLPNTRPLLSAQFWIALPVFILSEANLGALGLSVTEPLPSWGNLLRELESQTAALANPMANWWLLAPVALLISVVSLLQLMRVSKGSV